MRQPDFRKRFYIQCDASCDGVGGVLFQLGDDESEHPIMYMSQKLNPALLGITVLQN